MSRESTGLGQGTLQKFAVEKEGVQDEVLGMWRKGMAGTQISSILAQKGIKIAPVSINRFLAAQRAQDSLITQTVSKEKYDLLVMDYKSEIMEILDDVKKMRNIARDEMKLDTYAKLVGKLYDGMELLAKLSGDIKAPGSVDINIVINEINQRTFDEKKGVRDMLHGHAVVDVEAEIVEDDRKLSEKLQGEKNEDNTSIQV